MPGCPLPPSGVCVQSGSLAAMSEVWGKGEHVQCIHPLSGCIAGRQAVRCWLRRRWRFVPCLPLLPPLLPWRLPLPLSLRLLLPFSGTAH